MGARNPGGGVASGGGGTLVGGRTKTATRGAPPYTWCAASESLSLSVMMSAGDRVRPIAIQPAPPRSGFDNQTSASVGNVFVRSTTPTTVTDLSSRRPLFPTTPLASTPSAVTTCRVMTTPPGVAAQGYAAR